MKKNIVRLLKALALTFYGLMIVGLGLSGLAVHRIRSDYDYVATKYAKAIDVEDFSYFYREVGTQHSETILLIHGFLGSSYDFIDVMESLQDRYHLIAVDLIGFGLSEKSLAFHYSKQNQADYLVKFLDQLAISNVTIIAHSMGGEVAFHLAHDYPEYVSKMILVGSAGYVSEAQGSVGPPALPLFFYDYLVQNYYIQRTFFFTAYSKDEIQSQRVTQQDFDEMYFVNRTIPGTVLRAFSLDNDTGSTNAKLANVHQPILLIWGSEDGFIPLRTGEALLAALTAQAELFVIPQAGHLPFDTYFVEFMEKVEAFLE